MSRPRNNRIGRNDPCHCGSGNKFKHCHGALPPVPVRRGPLPADMQRALEEHKANELRREQQQGLGKPIIGTRFKRYQIVGVGNRIHYGKWKTFFDFLDNYLKDTMGSEWGNAEISKPLSDRHPVLQWYDAICTYQRETAVQTGEIRSAPMIGAAAAYYGLAYNLYLLAHNVELQRRLIERLKDRNQFRGAYYEALVAAWFILAGFKLELEDEGDPNSKHCEFSAASASGKSYSVEAKSRAPNKMHLDVGNQLYDALCKDAAHQRVVLIDVNVPNDASNTEERWLSELVPAVKNREAKMTIRDQPAPPAFVLVTNHPYHYDPEGTGVTRAALALGFKIEDFGASASFSSLIDAFKAKQKYADLFRLVQAIGDYSIPTTFDGEVPEFAYGQAERKWKIGETYHFPDIDGGVTGVLTTGTVLEQEKNAYLAIQTQDDRSIIVTAPMTDAEMAAHRSHPDTFFGMHRKVGGNMKSPFDLFEWFYENHTKTPRDKLLEWLKPAQDFAEISKLPDDELLLVFCDRHVGAVMAKTANMEPAAKMKGA